VRADLGGAKHPKVPGLVNGRFDAQNAALLVVHLDGIGIEAVFDANALGPLFERAEDLAFKVTPDITMGGDAMAQKRMTSALEKLVMAWRTSAG